MRGQFEAHLKVLGDHARIMEESFSHRWAVILGSSGIHFANIGGLSLDHRGAIRQSQMYDVPSPMAKMPSKIKIFVLRQHKNSRYTDNVQAQFP